MIQMLKNQVDSKPIHAKGNIIESLNLMEAWKMVEAFAEQTLSETHMRILMKKFDSFRFCSVQIIQIQLQKIYMLTKQIDK